MYWMLSKEKFSEAEIEHNLYSDVEELGVKLTPSFNMRLYRKKDGSTILKGQFVTFALYYLGPKETAKYILCCCMGTCDGGVIIDRETLEVIFYVPPEFKINPASYKNFLMINSTNTNQFKILDVEKMELVGNGDTFINCVGLGTDVFLGHSHFLYSLNKQCYFINKNREIERAPSKERLQFLIETFEDNLPEEFKNLVGSIYKIKWNTKN